MLDDWKQAWRQAVENFQREIRDADAGTPLRVRSMERELTSAGGALTKLDQEIRRTQQEAAQEHDAEAVCRRREALARGVGDEETVRIAIEFAGRHAERAAVLDRKARVLEEERALLARDVDEMRRVLTEAGAAAAAAVGGGASGQEPSTDTRTPHDDRDFARMEHEARQRAAEARLEELKRKFRPTAP